MDTAFLYWSTDHGASWSASPATRGLNECSIAFWHNASDGDIFMSCRPPHPRSCYAHPSLCDMRRVQLVWRRGAIVEGAVPRKGPIDPGCDGSVVNHRGVLYMSNPATTTSRSRMTVRRSDDGGATWTDGELVRARTGPHAQFTPRAPRARPSLKPRQRSFSPPALSPGPSS